MKKLLTLVVVLVVSVAVGACAPKATKDDCASACQKRAELQKPASAKPATPDLTKSIDAEFQKKIQDLGAKKVQALADIDKEMQAKLTATKKKGDKAKVTEDFANKKKAKEDEFASQTQALQQQQAQAVKAAQAASAKAAADEVAAIQKAVSDCSDKCLQDVTRKPKVDCQLKATNLAEFDKCK